MKNWLKDHRVFLVILGLILLSMALLQVIKHLQLPAGRNSLLEATTESQNTQSEIVVKILGQVQKPGVYRLQNGSRIEDLIIAAGGISANADRVWVVKTLNFSEKLSSGQEIIIPAN